MNTNELIKKLTKLKKCPMCGSITLPVIGPVKNEAKFFKQANKRGIVLVCPNCLAMGFISSEEIEGEIQVECNQKRKNVND